MARGSLLCVLVAWVSLYIAAASPPVPSREKVEQDMQRADDKLKETMKDFECSWTRGVYFVGEMARWELTQNETILQYMTEWADQNHWAPCKAEDHGDPTYGDNQACTATYLKLYELDPKSREKSHIQPTLDAFALQLANSSDSYWWWIDSIFMAGAPWANAGRITGESKYAAKLQSMFNATAYHSYHLWNGTEGLFYRDMRFLGKSYPNGQMFAWGRGNGWAIAALVRIMDALPPGDPSFPYWLGFYRSMAASVLPWQSQEDGMWRSSLTDPGFVPNPETTSSSLITYALAAGLRQGYLSPGTYRDPVLRAWEGLSGVALQSDGVVGYCQGIGYQPVPANKTSTSDFCVGTFLLAGSEVARLADGQ